MVRQPSSCSSIPGSCVNGRRYRDSVVVVALVLAPCAGAHAQGAPAQDEVEEIGTSPLYYRLPEIDPTAYFHAGPSFAIDCVNGATAWGVRVGGGVAMAIARDPRHVVAFEGGYAYRGFDDHLGSLGVSYLFTDTDDATEVSLQPGLVVSSAVIGGGRASAPGLGMRVAVGLRFLYFFEVAYEWLPAGNELEHVVAFTMGGSAVAW